jgi:hypothetical protein
MIWYEIKKKKPIATESGCWDGLRSSEILVCTRLQKYHVAVMYEGILDGAEFCQFYDVNDYEIGNVTHWTGIDSPY